MVINLSRLVSAMREEEVEDDDDVGKQNNFLFRHTAMQSR